MDVRGSHHGAVAHHRIRRQRNVTGIIAGGDTPSQVREDFVHIGCTACNADGHRQTDASMEGGYREAGGLAPHLSDALSVASAMSATSRSGGGATTGRQMPSPLWHVQGGSASLASPRGAALILFLRPFNVPLFIIPATR